MPARRLSFLALFAAIACLLSSSEADAGHYRYGYGGYGPSVYRTGSYNLGYHGAYGARGYLPYSYAGYSPYVAGHASLGTLRPTYSSFYRPYNYGYYGVAAPAYAVGRFGYPGGYYGRYSTGYRGYAPYSYSTFTSRSTFYGGTGLGYAPVHALPYGYGGYNPGIYHGFGY